LRSIRWVNGTLWGAENYLPAGDMKKTRSSGCQKSGTCAPKKKAKNKEVQKGVGGREKQGTHQQTSSESGTVCEKRTVSKIRLIGEERGHAYLIGGGTSPKEKSTRGGLETFGVLQKKQRKENSIHGNRLPNNRGGDFRTLKVGVSV